MNVSISETTFLQIMAGVLTLQLVSIEAGTAY